MAKNRNADRKIARLEQVAKNTETLAASLSVRSKSNLHFRPARLPKPERRVVIEAAARLRNETEPDPGRARELNRRRNGASFS